MTSKTQPVTLENISKLLDETLDRKFDQKLAPIYGELDDLKNQIIKLDHKVDTRFDESYDAIQEVTTALEENTDKKIAELRSEFIAA